MSYFLAKSPRSPLSPHFGSSRDKEVKERGTLIPSALNTNRRTDRPMEPAGDSFERNTDGPAEPAGVDSFPLATLAPPNGIEEDGIRSFAQAGYAEGAAHIAAIRAAIVAGEPIDRIEPRLRALADSLAIAWGSQKGVGLALMNALTDSRTDALTGVYNSKQFEEDLKSAFKTAQQDPTQAFSVVLIDVDNFRLFNNTCQNHAIGDSALKAVTQIAQHYSSKLAKPAKVFRLGGDEFGILIPHQPLNHHTASTELAKTILDGLPQLSFKRQGEEGIRQTLKALSTATVEHRLTLSMGLLTFDPKALTDPASLSTWNTLTNDALEPSELVAKLKSIMDPSLLYPVKDQGRNGLGTQVLGGSTSFQRGFTGSGSLMPGRVE